MSKENILQNKIFWKSTKNALLFLVLPVLILIALSSSVLADLYLNSRTGSVYLNTSNTARMQITSGGNLVLLGLANVSIPGNLSVGGNMSVDGNTLFVDADSNRVGIGTTNPQEKLVVIGNVNISGTLNVTGNIYMNNLLVNASISLDSYNKSVSLDLYNKSISLDSYNKSVILPTCIQITGSADLCDANDATGGTASVITNLSDANLSNLNVFSLNNSALNLFNKSISLDSYNKSISLNLYNQSISLDIYNKSISLDNYNKSISLIDYMSKTYDNIISGINKLYSNVFFYSTNITFGANSTINSSILPTLDNTFSLGNGSQRWNVNATSIQAVNYEIGWTNLSNYPVACPAGNVFMTALGDSITCTTFDESGKWNLLNLTNYFGGVDINGSLIRVGNLTNYNKSISLDNYNRSISLNNYNQSVSLDNYLKSAIQNNTDAKLKNLNITQNLTIQTNFSINFNSTQQSNQIYITTNETCLIQVAGTTKFSICQS